MPGTDPGTRRQGAPSAATTTPARRTWTPALGSFRIGPGADDEKERQGERDLPNLRPLVGVKEATRCPSFRETLEVRVHHERGDVTCQVRPDGRPAPTR